MSDAPQRIRLSRVKGWRMPAGAVKVDRSTRWGNPFRVGEDIGGRGPVDQAGAVQMFRDMLADPELRSLCGYPVDLSPLRGRHLACWCALGEPCHADLLLEVVNGGAAQAHPDFWSIREAGFMSLPREDQVALAGAAFSAFPVMVPAIQTPSSCWQMVKQARELASAQVEVAAREDYEATWPQMEAWARKRGLIK